MNTELGCDFTIPLACMRVVLFTALSIRAPSIQMNAIASAWKRAEWERIVSPWVHSLSVHNRKTKKKKSGGNFVPSASTEWLGNKSKLTLTLSQRQGLLPPTRARQSVRPPEIKGRPARSLGIQSLVWATEVAAVIWKQPASGSPPSTSGQRLQKELLYVPSVPPLWAFIVLGRGATCFFYFTNTMSPLALHRPAVCSSQTPGRASFQSDTARRNKQKSHCMCSFCLQLGSVSALKTTVESSGVTLILARGIQCHNGIVEVDRPTFKAAQQT